MRGNPENQEPGGTNAAREQRSRGVAGFSDGGSSGGTEERMVSTYPTRFTNRRCEL